MFLDISIGIIVGGVTGFIAYPDHITFFVFGGIIFALLPDLDFLYFLIFGKNDGVHDHEHRDLLHYPILYVIIGSIIVSYFGIIWVILFIIISLAHFIHDSIGIGWGIKWLYPFSDNNYKFFYRDPENNNKRGIVKVFSKEKLEMYVEKYGDPDWIKNIYGHFTPTLIVELLSLVIAITVVILWIVYK